MNESKVRGLKWNMKKVRESVHFSLIYIHTRIYIQDAYKAASGAIRSLVKSTFELILFMFSFVLVSTSTTTPFLYN